MASHGKLTPGHHLSADRSLGFLGMRPSPAGSRGNFFRQIGVNVAINNLVEFGDDFRSDGQQLTRAFAEDRANLGCAIGFACTGDFPSMRPAVVHRAVSVPRLLMLFRFHWDTWLTGLGTRVVLLINELKARTSSCQELYKRHLN